MFTTRTTVLSSDPTIARSEFDHWVHHETVVTLVLLGTGAGIESIVSDADKMANKLDNLAHVLWARDPDALAGELESLEGDAQLLKQLRGCQGFGLSLTDKVVDVICSDEPPPDLVRLLQVFTKALKQAKLPA